MVTVDDVRGLASGFPRSYEVLVRDRDEMRELVTDAWRMVVPAAFSGSGTRPRS